MSTTIGMECRTCASHGGTFNDVPDLNITSNLSPMLAEAGLKNWWEMHERPVAECGRHMLDVLDRMREDEDRWRAMNPPNGWGDYDACVQGRMRAWAERAVTMPSEIVASVS